MKKHYSFVQEDKSFLGLKFGLTKDDRWDRDKLFKRYYDELPSGDGFLIDDELATKPIWRKAIANSKAKIISNGAHVGGIVGGVTGSIAGGALGHGLSSKIFKVKQRNQIKQVILSSDSPEDCIKKLQEIGTPLTLKYCDAVNKVYQKYPNSWKNRLLDSINIKNIAAQAGGTIGGTYAGNRLGRLDGLAAGAEIATW